MASVGSSLDTAISGLQKGIEQARRAGAELGQHTEKLNEASSDSADEDKQGKGSIIDVTA
ncbi:MAG: hypothetical protein PVG75_05800 [Thioalkalispiraceae bacterium]|jgi:exonuclease VII small subunit